MDTLCLCRACLSTKSTEYIELDAPLSKDKTYLDCFNVCTQLTARSGDELPSMICSNCAQSLQNAYEFIMTALESNATLLHRLSDQEVVVLSPKSSETLNDALIIENMEIVVIKSLEEKPMESCTTTIPDEKLVDENSTYIIDEFACIENDPDNRNMLEIHDTDDLTNSATWKCRHCKNIFDSSISYEDHMRDWHKNMPSFKCTLCSKDFRTQKSLERHTNLRHNTVKDEAVLIDDCIALIPCNLCSKVFSSTEMLKFHEKSHDNLDNLDNQIACSLCNKKFPASSSHELNEHLRMEHSMEEKLYEEFADDLIEHCDEAENSDGESIECIKLEDTDKQSMECSICKKKILGRNMEKHLKLHTTKQENFLCAYCPRHFKNQKSVRQHEKTHYEESEDIVYVCPSCDRQFSRVSLLEQHRKNTHKEREHVCNICGNAFKLRNQLTNHMKLHLEKNIQCPHCDKKYARQFDLNVHLRSHTGELPYQCHLCNKRFAIKVRLTYHLQKHYGVKHTCKECFAQFNSKQKLKTHSFKHTGMPYRCELCDNHGFPNRDVFKRHLLRVHNATISEEALLEMFQRFTGKTTRIKEVSVAVEEDNEINQKESVKARKFQSVNLKAEEKDSIDMIIEEK